MPDGVDDPFKTAELRGRVLDAWAASAARFREDANAEEDYALGGYRDRVVVELAQNAADAAARAGVPGRLRLTLRDGVLVAANTGAPLDAAGVEALSTLRASSKRGQDTAGRFGVGFAAVVAVSDAPAISSVTGSVRWSRDETRELAGRVPALAGELAERSGHVPVLRLPFPAEGAPPDGFTTAVTLPLRDPGARELAERLLAQAGPALLLALPALSSIEIEAGGVTRLLTAARDGDDITITVDGPGSASQQSRWRTTAAGGRLAPGLLADRPSEERSRTSWSVSWAVPLTSAREPAGRLPGGVDPVVHAPTPTDEPLGLPALLLASFPLGPDRRHVAPGPLTDFLTERAADVYAGMLPGLAPGGALLDLVPGPAGRGELDARLGRAIRDRLPEVPFLPAAGSGERIRPADALLLGTAIPGLAGFLAPVLPNLIAGPARHSAYAVLGVRRLPLADLADALAALDRPPAWWRGLYDALGHGTPEDRAELGALPVPLADGRLVRGARGLLLPGPGLQHPGRLGVLGLRVVDPEAAHPLLARLGAIEATPSGVLRHPSARAAVEASYDEEDPEPVADIVLGLVAAANAGPGDYPWLSDLALPDADGEWSPAGELLLPDSPLAGVIKADAPFGTIDKRTLDRYGAAALAAAGVLSSFELLTAHDVDLDDPGLNLDDVQDWAYETTQRLPRGAVPPAALEVTAVRDLEFVDPDRWPLALEMLAAPPLRAALTEPVRVRLADGRHVDVTPYTAWWLRRHVRLGGRRPGELRAADADPLLAGLYDEADPGLAAVLADPVIGRALGVRTTLAGLLADAGGPEELLNQLADPKHPVTRPQLRALWTALATAGLTPDEITPPEQVRAVRGTEVVVADAEDVLVLDAPDLWPLCAKRPLILAPHHLASRLADLLDLPLAAEEIPGTVESSGRRTPVPPAVRAVLPGRSPGLPGTRPARRRRRRDPLALPGRRDPRRDPGGAGLRARVGGGPVAAAPRARGSAVGARVGRAAARGC